jgi:hypothetical protein
VTRELGEPSSHRPIAKLLAARSRAGGEEEVGGTRRPETLRPRLDGCRAQIGSVSSDGVFLTPSSFELRRLGSVSSVRELVDEEYCYS